MRPKKKSYKMKKSNAKNKKRAYNSSKKTNPIGKAKFISRGFLP